VLFPGAVALLVLGACAGPGVAGAPAGTGSQQPVVARQDEVLPTSLRIPAIGVEQPELLRLGVAEDGTAEVPQDFARVGWFDRGATPGPTVLLGHVDSRAGPAVFVDLRDLRPGDVIEVGYSDGTRQAYVVERTRQLPKDAFPTFEVFGATPGDVLRLVTCAGEFDDGARSYVDNLVVDARAG